MSKQDIETDDDGEIGSTPRWLAGTVMLVAVAGFTGLAYYAYHAGTRSIKEDELLLVEADSSPVKEAPADPGGMKFPHQDKTIFDAIASAPKEQAAEKVAAAPEQPVAKEAIDTVKPWVNDKLAENSAEAPVAKESLIVSTETAAAAPAPAPSAIENKLNAMAPASGGAHNEKPLEAVTVSEVPVATDKETVQVEAKQPEKVELKAAEKPAEKPAEEKKAETPKVQKKSVASPVGGKGTVQLGAYRSEAEAKSAWKKIQGKHAALSSAGMDVQRADLGSKGVFYRLRAMVSAPKDVCSKLTAKGQACMVVKG